jgi:hypothetical protein
LVFGGMADQKTGNLIVLWRVQGLRVSKTQVTNATTVATIKKRPRTHLASNRWRSRHSVVEAVRLNSVPAPRDGESPGQWLQGLPLRGRGTGRQEVIAGPVSLVLLANGDEHRGGRLILMESDGSLMPASRSTAVDVNVFGSHSSSRTFEPLGTLYCHDRQRRAHEGRRSWRRPRGTRPQRRRPGRCTAYLIGRKR